MEDQNCLFSDTETGIDYVVAQEYHKEEAVKLLAKTFGETCPMTVALGGNEQIWAFIFNMLWDTGVVRNKISVVALEKETTKVVGAFIAEDQTYPGMGICEGIKLTWHWMKFDQGVMAPFFKAVEKMTETLWVEHKRIVKEHKLPSDLGVSADMTAIAVDPSFGKRGIGSKLSELCFNLIKDKGFYIVYSQVSSAYSKKAIEKLGLTSHNSIDYKSYCVPGSCGSQPTYPFTKVADPHTACHLIWLNLKGFQT